MENLSIYTTYFFPYGGGFFGRCIVLKCGLCGKEVDEQPMITAEGKCSVCGAKLKPA